MSDSTQLVPYFPLSDMWEGEKLTDRMTGMADRLSAVFINIENRLASNKVTEQTTPYEKLAKSLQTLNEFVIQPAVKSGNYFLETLDGMEKDAQSAQMLDMSVDKYQSIKYASEQSGGDRKTLEGSIKNLSTFWNANKAGEVLLNKMGVTTRGEDGSKRDNAEVFLQLAQSLGDMDKNEASLQAGLLGIDEGTLNAMQHGLAQYADDYQRLMQATDLNAEKSAGQSTQFMISWRRMSSVVDLFGKKLSGNLAQGLSDPVTNLTEKLLSKAPQIENVLGKAGAIAIWFGEVFTDALSGIIDLVTDVADWWDTLDGESQSFIATLTGLAGAWVVLNSAFIASPIGIILSLVAAIGLLYNDYQKWKSGSDSLIDWEKWEPAISAAADGIKSIAWVFQDVVKALGGWETVFKGFAAYVSVTWAAQMISAINRVIKALSGLDSNSTKNLPTKFIGKVGFAGAAAVALEPVIDKGLDWAFGNSDYYQRIRTAPTWKDFGRAVIGEGDAKWIDGKWIDNRGKGEEAQTDGWAQFSKRFPPSLDSFSHLAQPGVESIMLSGYGNNSDWRYATSAEVQANTSNTAVSSPTWNNNTSIVINSASDPFTTGAEVEQRQLNIYARQAQLVSGGVS